ncbi:efflux RND transporter periplasmic adaptor subunit [Brevibacillus laterosporus]|uniref:efflux RND transporter periplasmic adaptor subunit n=1 Tax=Brevibacillus laterosporus TaxID=1465 RepID=UPI002656F33E|nr:efflux RND transporter periplasmic adaptor subunit [Brevibacillus laterosporus]MDN9008965.1 efflux RND transporter periplasmic adaptor subunit [Brevibacillus laterosporus]MDO0941072.1 efflux RND transporter periplasmic adaptor subunit [Brevibacillus laterosporus]
MRRVVVSVLGASMLIVSGCGGHVEPVASVQEEKNNKWVETYKIEQAPTSTLQGYSGVVEANKQVMLGFGSSGKIAQVNTEKGAQVQQGQVLASLDAKAYQVAAQAAAGQVQSATVAAQETRKGASQEALAQQKIRLEREQQIAAEAKKAAKQGDVLFQGGALSKNDYEALLLKEKQAEMSVKNEQIALQELQRGANPDQLARANAAITQANSEAVRAQESLQQTKIIAPFSGTIVAVHEQTGKVVAGGQSVIELVDLKTVKVVLAVENDEVGFFAEGKQVEVQGASGVSSKGTIQFVSPVIDQANGKYRVEINMNNSDKKWRGGMIANVKVPRPLQGFLLPLECVGLANETHFVMKVENGIVRKQPVQVGQIINGSIEIVKGVSAGEQVVKSGITYIVDGENVAVKGVKQ